MEHLQIASNIMSAIISFGSICIMLYTLLRFLAKPHDNLEQRVTILETKVGEHERSLEKGNNDFREIRQALEALQSCMSIVVDFEVSFCDRMEYKEGSEEIIEARRRLREFSAGK